MVLSPYDEYLIPGIDLEGVIPLNNHQEYVYHTNSSLWMGWDSYGNTADQTCSAIIPSWVYPGGSGINYNCRAGYWIIGKINGEFVEGTTGQYIISEGTEPGDVSLGWENPSNDYSEEPWLSIVTWYIPDAGLTVTAERRSWSYPGDQNYFFKIGDHDFNDFVIEEITITNTGNELVEELIIGMKADHDCAWNVPNPDWDYSFWTDDIVDYDEETMATIMLDGDDPSSSENDFGIDDPARQYRGVKVGQVPINLNGKNYDELEPTDVTHMWWTGDEDPQTAEARYNIATNGWDGDGDKKDENPPPMDMRYLQAYGPWNIEPGDSVVVVTAVVAGSGMENLQKAVNQARMAYDWNYNLPKPPAAPQIASDGIEALPDGSVEITWAYSDDQIAAIDPDKGTADFAGFRVYRSVETESWDASELYELEGLTPDPEAAIEEGTPYPGSPVGPFSLIAEGTASDFALGSGEYGYIDSNTQDSIRHWYYVAAYDEAGSDAIHGDVPSLQSFYTVCHPMVLSPYDEYLIPGIDLEGVIPYTDVSVDEEKLLPMKFALHQNYPNPFNPLTSIKYDLPMQSHVEIFIYDIMGRAVKALVNESQNAGFRSVIWDATNDVGQSVSAGIYLYRINALQKDGSQTGSYQQVQKMVLLK
jgi:hypothetical protein